MSNLDTVNEFVDALLKAPDHVMQAVQLRLAHTDYELKLLKADPLKPYESAWREHADPYMFPFMTGEGVKGGGH